MIQLYPIATHEKFHNILQILFTTPKLYLAKNLRSDRVLKIDNCFQKALIYIRL